MIIYKTWQDVNVTKASLFATLQTGDYVIMHDARVEMEHEHIIGRLYDLLDYVNYEILDQNIEGIMALILHKHHDDARNLSWLYLLTSRGQLGWFCRIECLTLVCNADNTCGRPEKW